MKFCIYTPTPQREKLGGFLVANFLSYFPKENGLKFVTPRTSENFTTFSTARKEIYHLELTLGATSRNVLRETLAKQYRWRCVAASNTPTVLQNSGLFFPEDTFSANEGKQRFPL